MEIHTITMCDRCGTTHRHAYINEAYLVDDPGTTTGALCPDCALDDDPQHIVGSWLLTWD